MEGGISPHTKGVFYTELKGGRNKFISLAARKGKEEQTKGCDSEQINLLQYTENIWDEL